MIYQAAKLKTLIAIVAFLCIVGLTAHAESTLIPLDRVVAIVNNGVITQTQINTALEELQQHNNGEPIVDKTTLRTQVLNQAIDELLQLQVAQRANIKISDQQLDQTISRIAQQNNLTVAQLKTALQKQGISYDYYRDQIHNQMLIHEVEQQALANKIKISEEEVKDLLKHPPQAPKDQIYYHLADLLIPLNTDDSTSAEALAAQKQATDLLKKARSGKNFEELATGDLKYTDLQWRSLKDMPTIFVPIITQLKKVGDIAGPVQAPNGLHLIQLEEVHGMSQPLTETEAKQMLMLNKMRQEVANWVQELRKRAYIKII